MLKTLFIKNYKDVENPDVRNKYGKVAGIFGIITNLFLGISNRIYFKQCKYYSGCSKQYIRYSFIGPYNYRV